MSIFEKAFEKAGKNDGERPADDLFDDRADNLPDFPGDPVEGEPESVSADTEDSAGVAETVVQQEPWNEGLSHTGSGKLVKLDLSGLRDAGLVDPRSKEVNRTTEEFRRIKRPLLMNIRGEGASVVPNANMIMVSSALPGEGKTFTSINLAMSIAMEMDRTVLLVDADVAKPDVTARLGVEAEKGLIDVLLDDSLTLPDVLLRTDIPKLALLPSGSRHVHSTELLASERMRQLTLELSSRYPDRIVIFDSPPLLLASEARVLAGLMGQVVMVVEESMTRQHAAQEAVEMLADNEIVGIVMNKGRHKSKEGGYGGYGYYPYTR
ncbi:MAG: XrtA-associated tyrosine autokinase [Gammaproteobacteria bacterium]|nr:XrtA-associated tyrosine autokinase [Gammaproteobacteria bacterium]